MANRGCGILLRRSSQTHHFAARCPNPKFLASFDSSKLKTVPPFPVAQARLRSCHHAAFSASETMHPEGTSADLRLSQNTQRCVRFDWMQSRIVSSVEKERRGTCRKQSRNFGPIVIRCKMVARPNASRRALPRSRGPTSTARLKWHRKIRDDAEKTRQGDTP